MKIGYPCINQTLDCSANKTFRLRSYSESRLRDTLQNNLDCLLKILDYNVKNNILFFRISSDLVPFASHPVCRFRWYDYFKKDFKEIGRFIKKHDIRISMHPDQFTLINSPRKDVLERSISELLYHARILDAMELSETAKIQIHVGGVYGDKKRSMAVFVERYKKLPKAVLRRLVIENDDRLYTFSDCLEIHKKTKIPVLFDVFHHSLNNNGESLRECLKHVIKTWKAKDGLLMIDYSLQKKNAKRGTHAYAISIPNFKRFLR
ncbi:MAG: UV DNA damage repair endonuclease UvsE, partial [Candidatus Omnitrophota bacterium]